MAIETVIGRYKNAIEDVVIEISTVENLNAVEGSDVSGEVTFKGETLGCRGNVRLDKGGAPASLALFVQDYFGSDQRFGCAGAFNISDGALTGALVMANLHAQESFLVGYEWGGIWQKE
ncbi:hypothetical protein JYG36_15095 [Pseudomonas sp. SORT22]|uniref:hypothetical protein n=1 Tax=Pseudomonas sp. SORT22 TaxID=2813842 RepID=UPI001BCCB964|nr:hypothetical protein [Pseudomonas sp. SORT22]QVM94449.1 hypothetical protein JYG36_15095 [Pseudomonas sp. SORT22]